MKRSAYRLQFGTLDSVNDVQSSIEIELQGSIETGKRLWRCAKPRFGNELKVSRGASLPDGLRIAGGIQSRGPQGAT
jgi:hypothetical protein